MAIIKLPIIFYAKKVRINFQYVSFSVFQGRRKKPRKSEKKIKYAIPTLSFISRQLFCAIVKVTRKPILPDGQTTSS